MIRHGVFAMEDGGGDELHEHSEHLLAAVKSLTLANSMAIEAYTISVEDEPIVVSVPPETYVVGMTSPTTVRFLSFATAVPEEQTLRMIKIAKNTNIYPRSSPVLPHPCIMQIASFLEVSLPTSPHCAVVTKGFSGQSLSDAFAANTALDSHERLQIIVSILCAVEHYHVSGKVHGHVIPRTFSFRQTLTAKATAACRANSGT